MKTTLCCPTTPARLRVGDASHAPARASLLNLTLADSFMGSAHPLDQLPPLEGYHLDPPTPSFTALKCRYVPCNASWPEIECGRLSLPWEPFLDLGFTFHFPERLPAHLPPVLDLARTLESVIGVAPWVFWGTVAIDFTGPTAVRRQALHDEIYVHLPRGLGVHPRKGKLSGKDFKDAICLRAPGPLSVYVADAPNSAAVRVLLGLDAEAWYRAGVRRLTDLAAGYWPRYVAQKVRFIELSALSAPEKGNEIVHPGYRGVLAARAARATPTDRRALCTRARPTVRDRLTRAALEDLENQLRGAF